MKYFDKFLNVKANFIFMTPTELSLHSKLKGLLRTNNYTEFTLKRSTLDSCLATIKSDATDFIQSFCYEKISNLFAGSYLYFQNAILQARTYKNNTHWFTRRNSGLIVFNFKRYNSVVY